MMEPESSQARAPQPAPAAPETPAEKPRRGALTRARLLDAAEEVFGQLGYHGASIVEITRRAGVGLGTFYLYFPSKIEVYRRLLRARQEEFIQTASRVSEGAQDQRAVVQAAFGAFFDWISEHPSFMRLMREAEFIDPALAVELYGTPAEEYRSRLARAMEQGGLPRTDPEVLAWCLMGMTEFVTLRWIVWPGAPKLERERYEAFVDILARALGVSPPQGA